MNRSQAAAQATGAIGGQSHEWSRMAIIAAAVLWSSSGLFAKSEVFAVWPEQQRGPLMTFWRAIFAGLAVLPLVRRPSFRWSMLPLGVTFAIMTSTFLTALTLGTGANAIWIQYTSPGWVFLAGKFLWREPLERRAWMTLVPAVLGVGLILGFELSGLSGEKAQWGVLSALVSALAYTAVILQLRRLRHEEGAWLTVVNQALTALVLLPFVLWWQVWPTGEQLAWLAGFGIFQMGLPYLLFCWGLKHVGSQEATLLTLLEPILLPIWAYLTVHEIPAWWTVAGAAIILAGFAARYGGEWLWPASTAANHQATDQALHESPRIMLELAESAEGPATERSLPACESDVYKVTRDARRGARDAS
jgi:drug/metabolite transporter (DMT)-like permease